MKKNISMILIMFLLLSLVSCKKDTAKNDGQTSTVEEVVTEEVKQAATSSEPKSDEVVSESKEQGNLTSTPTTQTFESTIATPKEVRFYKDGKYHVSKNEKLNNYVAQRVESWYKDYENDTLPLTKTAVTEEMIANIKYNEMAVEICFDYDQDIELLGKIQLEDASRLLVPLTGDQAYFVFRGYNAYGYRNGLHRVNGSGLEKYFEGMTFEYNAKSWKSSVIVPKTVTFYKDGMQTVSTDEELNYKIACHIEDWFRYEESIAAASLSANTDLINEAKRNEMAIELQFDGEVKFYGGVLSDTVRTLFIPITGEYDYLIFQNSPSNPNYWSGPILGEKGLEQFFDCVQFTPLTEEERRWTSTIGTARDIEFYENGKSIGNSDGAFKDYPFNRKLSQHIESWFYHKEEVPTVTVLDTPLENAWKNETYIMLWFNDNTFYGKQILSEKSSRLIIPLTGEYAYHIFEGTYDGMSNVAINIGGSGLEQFFEEFKSLNTNN